MKIFTIGHSTLSKETFLKTLQDIGIQQVVDVRSFPGSRKFPHFSQEKMSEWLTEKNITYHHLSKLGGRRKLSREVGVKLNDGWNNQSFHNYADYTQSEDFLQGVNELEELASEKRTVYFCAERHPSRCHRLIISNWLAANDWEVQHIIHNSKEDFEVVEHELGRWGALPIIEKDGKVVYPEIN